MEADAMIGKTVSKLTVLVLTTFLTACAGGTFETMYDSGPDPSVTRNWRVVEVNVAVPRTLSVSEAPVLVPKADIVWREDPTGNRYDQVSRIVAKGIRDGARSLKGQTDVQIDVTVSRFHAMTLEAEALRYDVGVHNIDFTARVVNARTGEVLVPPTFIRAEFPAMTGVRMTQARLRGETQKSQIEAHLANVIAGWLGVGPDPRATFTRLGG
jgi:hypothetical protein